MNPNITGQVLLWDRGVKPFKDEKHIVQIFGVLAVPPSIALEHMSQSWVKHTLTGDYTSELGLVLSGGLPHHREPIPNDINTASSIEQLMSSRMWRV